MSKGKVKVSENFSDLQRDIRSSEQPSSIENRLRQRRVIVNMLEVQSNSEDSKRSNLENAH